MCSYTSKTIVEALKETVTNLIYNGPPCRIVPIDNQSLLDEDQILYLPGSELKLRNDKLIEWINEWIHSIHLVTYSGGRLRLLDMERFVVHHFSPH